MNTTATAPSPRRARRLRRQLRRLVLHLLRALLGSVRPSGVLA